MTRAMDAPKLRFGRITTFFASVRRKQWPKQWQLNRQALESNLSFVTPKVGENINTVLFFNYEKLSSSLRISDNNCEIETHCRKCAHLLFTYNNMTHSVGSLASVLFCSVRVGWPRVSVRFGRSKNNRFGTSLVRTCNNVAYSRAHLTAGCNSEENLKLLS